MRGNPYPPPPVQPPVVGLLSSAIDGTSVAPAHWVDGISVDVENARVDDVFSWWDACGDDDFTAPGDDVEVHDLATSPKPTTVPPDDVFYHPWGIVVDETCSALGWSADEYKARVRRRLIGVQTLKMEDELWTGAVAQAAGFPNRYLADPANVVELAVGPVALVHALGRLQMYLARTITGRGMIHATQDTVNLWVSAGVVRREGASHRDTFDNIIVAGGGYPGTDPDGVESVNGDTRWAYATGLVITLLDEPQIVPATLQEAVAKDVNTVTARGERIAAAFWDGIAHAGIEVNLCETCCTPGGS